MLAHSEISVNKNTIPHIKEIYNFSREKRIYFDYKFQEPAGRAKINDELNISPEELVDSYINLFDLWVADDYEQRPSNRFFEWVIECIDNLANNRGYIINPINCAYKNQCQHSFIAISPEGDIYPCGKFVGESDFLYDNINNSKTLSQILNNDIRKTFLKRHEGLAECESCRYLSMCNSGCPSNSFLFTGNIMSKNPFCYTNHKFFNYVSEKLSSDKNIVKSITKKQDDCSPNRNKKGRYSFIVNVFIVKTLLITNLHLPEIETFAVKTVKKNQEVNMFKEKCLFCKNDFNKELTFSDDKRFCSQKCKENHRLQTKRTCYTCLKEYSPINSTASDKMLYCSREHEDLIKICSNHRKKCGRKYNMEQSTAKNPSKFCSKECETFFENWNEYSRYDRYDEYSDYDNYDNHDPCGCY